MCGFILLELIKPDTSFLILDTRVHKVSQRLNKNFNPWTIISVNTINFIHGIFAVKNGGGK